MRPKKVTDSNLQKKRGMLFELNKNRTLYIMLMFGFIYLIINNYLPMLGISIAFKSINFRDGILASPWVGLKNFEFLFKSNYAFQIVRNTLLYNFTFLALDMVIPVAIAIGLNEIVLLKLKKVYQTCIFLPHFLSWVVVSMIAYAFLGMESGFINNHILPLFNMEKVNFYQEVKLWPFLLVFFNTWKHAGYSSVVYLAAITNIDPCLYEAADIDGAGKWKKIRYITIPSVSGLVVMMMLLGCGRIFTADFGLFYQMPLDSGSLYSVTNVISTYVYRVGLKGGEFEMGAAAGVLQSVVGFITVMGMNYLIKKIDNDKALF